MMGSVRDFRIVTMIGIFCVLQAAEREFPYDDPNCYCFDGFMSCFNLQQLPPLITGVNVTRLVALLLENGNIKNIPENSLPPGLKSIEIAHHPLMNISDEAFDTSATTLQYVSIIEALMRTLPAALSKLTSLKQLVISDTPIQQWGDLTLQHLASSVYYLDLRNVSLTTWPSWVSYFQLLTRLDLSGNKLNHIPDDGFNNIKDKLRELIVPDTGLTNIPQALFTLSNLITLDLSNNNFTDVNEIKQIIVSPLAKTLKTLSLDSIGLTRVFNFTTMTNLISISLRSNKLTDITADSLPPFLNYFYLDHNRLSSVPSDVASLSQLSDLSLSDNLIADIEPNSFPPSVDSLDLSYNNLSIITNSTFRNLSLLQRLYLDYNPISRIWRAAFSELTSLLFLYIGNTHLSEIPLAFASLDKLHIFINMNTSEPLSCPCPAPSELVNWYASSFRPTLSFANCGNGLFADSYLSGDYCGNQTTTT